MLEVFQSEIESSSSLTIGASAVRLIAEVEKQRHILMTASHGTAG